MISKDWSTNGEYIIADRAKSARPQTHIIFFVSLYMCSQCYCGLLCFISKIILSILFSWRCIFENSCLTRRIIELKSSLLQQSWRVHILTLSLILLIKINIMLWLMMGAKPWYVFVYSLPWSAHLRVHTHLPPPNLLSLPLLIHYTLNAYHHHLLLNMGHRSLSALSGHHDGNVHVLSARQL